MRKIEIMMISVFIFLIIISRVSSSFGNSQTQWSSLSFSQTEDNQIWDVLDIITPTLDKVEWIEEAIYNRTPSWISSGRWYEAHSRLTLVKSDDIFVSLSEAFNWTAVNTKNWKEIKPELPVHFPSFDDFQSAVQNDPSWWLDYSWGIDVDWYGVLLDRIKMMFEFNPENSRADIFTWCHITHVPEYILAEKRVESYSLTGFDLTAVSMGNLEDLQWYEDYTVNRTYYYIYFKAPANILSQFKEMYTLTLDISPLYQGTSFSNVEQVIHVLMPSNSEVQNTSPGNMATINGNIATFTIHKHTIYPDAFIVESGPPIKDVTQSFLESAGHWLTEPSTWVAFATLTVLAYTAFSGKRIWSRRKTYYRLYRSMVNVYEHYALNFAQFYQEIENLSRSVTKYFIEGKITDEQFDKLLTRRDDLLERAKRLQPPVPPKY